MKVLVDTNVVLDLLLDRKRFSTASSGIFTRVEQGDVTGLLGATTVTTIHYLVSKTLGPKASHDAMKLLLRLFEIAPVNHLVLTGALDKVRDDFEDAVLLEAALHCGAQIIVTQDPKGFKGSHIPVLSPEEFLSHI